MSNEVLAVDVICYLPKDFYSKEVNENLIKIIMEKATGSKKWKPGNPDKGEPDYFCGEIPVEFTIASDRKKKSNYIQKLKNGTYNTVDLEMDAFQYIEQSINKKLEKNYSVDEVCLCVLCLMDLTCWVLDEYGSETQSELNWPRDAFFDEVKKQCINTKKFNNVFIIFPDVTAKWWVWDMKTGLKISIVLSEEEMLSGEFPFLTTVHDFNRLVLNSDV